MQNVSAFVIAYRIEHGLFIGIIETHQVFLVALAADVPLHIAEVLRIAGKKVHVIVKQTQAGKVFKLPIAVDVYNGSKKVRHNVWAENQVDTFTFKYDSRPDLVNVDGDKVLLAEKKDNKTLDNYAHQYKYAGTYLDRREAIDFAARNQDNPKAIELLKQGMKDKYHGLRGFAVSRLDLKKESVRKEMETAIADMAKNDPKSIVRAAALDVLSYYDNPAYKALYVKAISDSSYTVAGSGLEGLSKLDSVAALAEANKLAKGTVKGKLVESITKVLIQSGDEAGFDAVANAFSKMPLSQAKFNLLPQFVEFVGTVKDTEKVKKGIDIVVEFREILAPYGLEPFVNNLLTNVVKKKEKAREVAENKTAYQAQIDYIKAKIDAEKKGF